MLLFKCLNFSINNSLRCLLKLKLNTKTFSNNKFIKISDNSLISPLSVCHSQNNYLSTNDDSIEPKPSDDNESEQDFSQSFDFNSEQRKVPKTIREYKMQQKLQVLQPEMPRLARVVIIGIPNAGKSTITNQLVGWKISSVSSKVHTTRHKVTGVLVEDDIQVEFLDTPGLVTPKHCSKHNLEASFMSDPQTSVSIADIIAVISDVSNNRERERLNPGIIKLLEKHRYKKSILILNKIDKIKEKRKLLDITTRLTCGVVGGISSVTTIQRPVHDSKRSLEKVIHSYESKLSHDMMDSNNQNSDEEEEEQIGWNRFSRVFMVSALSGNGIEDIRQYFLDTARFKPWIYHRSQVTDQNPHELLRTTLQEKCLDLLKQEIPYKIKFYIQMWETDKMGNLFIVVDLMCPERFQSLIIGPKGQTISTLVRSTRDSLSNTFHCEVSLKLIVKGMKNK